MTNDLTLFDDFERSDGRRARGQVSQFQFLNRSAWPACEKVRTALEEWFADYPGDAKADIRSRIRKRDENHESAIFELFVHQLLLRLSLCPEVHRKPRTGPRKPDFLIEDRLGNLYYIEAKVAYGPWVPGKHPLEVQILEAINGIAERNPARIALRVETRGKLTRSQPLTPILDEVGSWLATIDPRSIAGFEPAGIPPLEIRRSSWALELRVFSLLSHESDRLIHVGPSQGSSGDDATALRRKILAKTRRYKLEYPLIVAINLPGFRVQPDDYKSALFGLENLIPQVDHDGHVPPAPAAGLRNGVWLDESGTRYSRLHGVTFFGGSLPYGMHQTNAWTYVNPFIDAKLPDELLRLGSARVEDGRIVRQAGPPPREILGLPEDWPGRPGMH